MNTSPDKREHLLAMLLCLWARSPRRAFPRVWRFSKHHSEGHSAIEHCAPEPPKNGGHWVRPILGKFLPKPDSEMAARQGVNHLKEILKNN